MVISAIIPHAPLTAELDQALKTCVASLGADEVIVVVNDLTGFAKAVNQGLRLATGDYLCIVNNDTILKGDLKDLIDPAGATIPLVNGKHHFGPFICLPRRVYEQVGELDERFETAYFEDNDLLRRIVLAGIPIIKKEVEVFHHEGMTTNLLPNRNEISDRNAERFETKWAE